MVNFVINRFNTSRWIVMGLIGTTVGIIGFFLHQSVTLIYNTKLHMLESLFEVSEFKLVNKMKLINVLNLLIIYEAPDFRRN